MSSSRSGARVLRPDAATVVGRPAAVPERGRVGRSASAPSWTLDDLGDVGVPFGLPAERPESEPSLATAPDAGPSLELLAAELEAARQEAYQQGLADGRTEAEASVADRVLSAVRALDSAIETVQDEERLWVANAEEHIVALAVAVARQVIDREVAADDAPLRALVARALAEFPASQPLTVRLHPDDLALIAAFAEESAAAGRAEIAWTGDARILRGGCMVEGRERIVDGRVDTALERLYRRLSGTSA